MIGKLPPPRKPPWSERERALRIRRAFAVGTGLAVIGVGAALVLGSLGSSDWKRTTAFPLVQCTVGRTIHARCGRLAVPEDPRRPTGRRISLRVVVIPSPRQPAAGALFYLEGGPGGAASASAASVNEVFAKVNARRDLVLVDQRGTGGSNPLSCPRDHVLVADAAAVAAYVRRCFAQLDGEPRFYTTAVAMDDLEAVRRALGYGRIALYGGSYGATAAQIFLRRHPRSVRTLILDGASLLDVPVYELQARNGERGLRVDLARCAAAAACRRAFPDTRAELDALLAERPRRMELAGHDPFVLDGDAVASTIRALSRTPEGAALVPRLVHDAAGGNDVPLAQAYASEVGPELDPRARLATSFVILCSEPWARFGVAATIRASAGTYLEHVTVAHARLFRRACGAVPKGVVPPDSGDPPRSRVPVLLVTGGADPQDPPANLAGWRTAFPNGRLIVLQGVGHGAIERGCLPLVAARFVARGTAAGLDASCVRAIRLPPFET